MATYMQTSIIETMRTRKSRVVFMNNTFLQECQCLRSLKSNFGGVYNGRRRGDFNENMLFEALGIIPDWDKIRYYILLDELF